MSVIATIISSTVAAILASEFRTWAPTISRALVKVATRWSVPDMRDRLIEEWSAHLEEVPGELGKIIAALGFLLAALRVASATSGLSRLDLWRQSIVSILSARPWRRLGDSAEGRLQLQKVASPIAIVLLIILMFASGAHKDLGGAVSNIAKGGGAERDWMIVAALALIVAMYVNSRRAERAPADGD